jgi:hypothetical protein
MAGMQAAVWRRLLLPMVHHALRVLEGTVQLSPLELASTGTTGQS